MSAYPQAHWITVAQLRQRRAACICGWWQVLTDELMSEVQKLHDEEWDCDHRWIRDLGGLDRFCGRCGRVEVL